MNIYPQTGNPGCRIHIGITCGLDCLCLHGDPRKTAFSHRPVTKSECGLIFEFLTGPEHVHGVLNTPSGLFERKCYSMQDDISYSTLNRDKTCQQACKSSAH
jgi:hypothetical protein